MEVKNDKKHDIVRTLVQAQVLVPVPVRADKRNENYLIKTFLIAE